MNRGISLWQIVHKTGNYLANIQRIEKGLTQPGVSLAFKLLQTIEILPGDLLANLALTHQKELPVSISPLAEIPINYERPLLSQEQKSLFGPMLLQARMAGMISQTAMAKACGYNLRNINAVEKGKQEPGIMTALSLVLVTGADVREFFNRLYYWQLEDNNTDGK